jgi:hypothetical protein
MHLKNINLNPHELDMYVAYLHKNYFLHNGVNDGTMKSETLPQNQCIEWCETNEELNVAQQLSAYFASLEDVYQTAYIGRCPNVSKMTIFQPTNLTFRLT